LAVISGIVGTVVPSWFSGGPITTQSIVFDPWISPTQLSPLVHVKSRTTGQCMGQSFTSDRGDAYRCTADDFIYDPCFVTPWAVYGEGGSEVACPGTNPNSIIVIRLTSPLPKYNASAGAAPNVWMVVLDDGEQCYSTSGSAGIVTSGNLSETFICPKSDTQLFGAVNKDSPTWKIYEQQEQGSNRRLYRSRKRIPESVATP
jgi:hypothetical protein